jgi:hypothetical protein
MARIHVLSGDGGNNFSAVVHAPTPTGNNAAGFAWSACILQAGLNVSVLTVGNGPGQTTQQEMNGIQAGTILEANFPFQDDPTQTNAQRLAYLDTLATQYITDLISRYQARLQYFGLTRT